jgi:hypothetical protein
VYSTSTLQHTKHFHHPTLGPDLAHFEKRHHCVFFCKQATASPEALNRTALAVVRPGPDTIKFAISFHPPLIIASATRS